MDNLYSSFYLYKKYEIIGDELVDLGIASIDADGTQEPVMKYECDKACGCPEPPPEPIYRWVQTEDTMCLEVEAKYVLTLDDSSVVSGECDSISTTNVITYNEISAYTNSIVSVEIGNCATHIDNGAFQNCTGITYIQIPSGITSIGNGAFSGCTGLALINFESDNPPTFGYGVFINTNVTIHTPCADIDAYKAALGTYADKIKCGLLDGKYKFMTDGGVLSAECNSTSAISYNDVDSHRYAITSAELGNCVTAITDSAFTSCYNMTNIEIPDTVTTIGDWAFKWCYNMPNITIPDSVTSIGTGAFYDLRDGNSLSEIRMSNNITSISPFLFSGDALLKRLNSDVDGVFNIPSGVTSIGEYAFQVCESLTSITIPDSVTSIGEGAFMNCSNLKNVIIPSGVTSIANEAFRYWYQLTSVICLATTPPALGAYAFEAAYGATSNLTIYVPAASVNAYKAAAGWSDYTSIIRAIQNS